MHEGSQYYCNLVPCTMHRALSVNEILREIFQHVCPLHMLGASRSTLACAARTCRIFTEPALDVLWQIIPDFMPLFLLLPSALEVGDFPLDNALSISLREVSTERLTMEASVFVGSG